MRHEAKAVLAVAVVTIHTGGEVALVVAAVADGEGGEASQRDRGAAW